MVEAVLSSEYLAGEDSLYWVRIDKEENLKQAQNVISVISGVKSIELDVKEAKAHDHELKVVDNCLVTVGGFVYIRQGE